MVPVWWEGEIWGVSGAGDQTDTNLDGEGDLCDNDDDGDGLLDVEEAARGSNALRVDIAIGNAIAVAGVGPVDNCPTVGNPNQRDTDAELPPTVLCRVKGHVRFQRIFAPNSVVANPMSWQQLMDGRSSAQTFLKGPNPWVNLNRARAKQS